MDFDEYLNIFDDIVFTMENDYSGCRDFFDRTVACSYRDKLISLKYKIDSKSFVSFIRDYLYEFKSQHLNFFDEDVLPQSVGFSVRRFKNGLFVTLVWDNVDFSVGDKILFLGDESIGDVYHKFYKKISIYGDGSEREIWNHILLEYEYCTVEDLLGVSKKRLLKYDAKNNIDFDFKIIDQNIGFMTIPRFYDAEKLDLILEKNKEILSNLFGLIIDVRMNAGGSDAVYYPLLQYIFNEKICLKNLDDDKIFFNMTQKNADLRIEMWKSFLNKEQSPEMTKYIHKDIDFCERHKGQGFVLSVDEDDFEFEGIIKPLHVVVLTDVYCRSSGDGFVQRVKKSPKVTVMGRATAGITDYSNCVFKKYDSYILIYPLSKASCVDKGEGILGKGNLPHIYIPWSLRHLYEDVDLREALLYIKSKNDKDKS